MTIETAATGLSPLVPFTEQHDHVRAPYYVRPTGTWMQDCRCGEAVRITKRVESQPPSMQVVLDAFERHYRDAARLTPEQCRVLTAADADPRGRLPLPTTLTTQKPLIARGLIVQAEFGHLTGLAYITGKGRGVLAEHRRRFA